MVRKQYQRKTQSKEQKYKGVLNDPMIFKSYNSAYENLPEFFERVNALFEHYEIQPHEEDAYAKLAFSLAQDHVPAFQMINERDLKKLGAPSKWKNTGEGLKLYINVKRVSIIEQRSERNAILAFYNEEKQESQYSRYKEVKSSLDDNVKDKLDELLKIKNEDIYKLVLAMAGLKLKNGCFALQDNDSLDGLIKLSKELDKNSGT